ncbi:MAG: hypothetical protein HOQ26_13005 [Gemmatimonadaceae bacterium]|nr:hypothetical protein [Gemmatimonadaceae bacterium]
MQRLSGARPRPTRRRRDLPARPASELDAFLTVGDPDTAVAIAIGAGWPNRIIADSR